MVGTKKALLLGQAEMSAMIPNVLNLDLVILVYA